MLTKIKLNTARSSFASKTEFAFWTLQIKFTALNLRRSQITLNLNLNWLKFYSVQIRCRQAKYRYLPLN